MIETLMAMNLLDQRDGGVGFGRWREAAKQILGPRSTWAGAIRPPAVAMFDRWAGPEEAVEEHRGLPAAVMPPDADPAVRRFFDLALARFWPRISAYLEADRRHRARIFAGGGVEGLFGALHPRIEWRPPVLEIAHEEEADIHTGGNGLVIVPSLFNRHRPMLFADRDRPDLAPRLLYPVPLDNASAATLWGGAPRPDEALGALVGRTRAGILRALQESSTTTDLSRKLNISPSAASQHATVLRASGLINSHRNVNTVVHSLTALGVRLLDGDTVEDTGPVGELVGLRSRRRLAPVDLPKAC